MYGRPAALAAAAALTLLLLTATPAAAELSIDLEVDGEPVEDGDSVEVGETASIQLYVESDGELNFVRTTLGAEEYSVGVDSTRFRLNQTVTTLLGDNSYSVYAEDLDGGSASVEVTLERPPSTEAEFRRAVRQYQSRVDEMEREIDQLRNRSEQLSEENEQLRQEVEQMEGETGSPLPGFGFVAATLAVLAAWAFTVRSRSFDR